jgi:abhydrolase domain-containing protein 4
MIHGFGAGLLQFYKNLDHLHADRRLLAFDLPGFGRSSRVKFPKDPEKAEMQFVDMIERWREEVGVRKCGVDDGTVRVTVA